MQPVKYFFKKGVLLGIVSSSVASYAAEDNQRSNEHLLKQQLVERSRVYQFLRENEEAAGVAPSEEEERLACLSTRVHQVQPSHSLSLATMIRSIAQAPAHTVARLFNLADFAGSTGEEARRLGANLAYRNTYALHLIENDETRRVLEHERGKNEVVATQSEDLSDLFASGLLQFQKLVHEEKVNSVLYAGSLILFSKMASDSFLLDLNKAGGLQRVACMGGGALTKNWIANIQGDSFSYQSTNSVAYTRDIVIPWRKMPVSWLHLNVINDDTFMVKNVDEMAVIKIHGDGTRHHVKIFEVDIMHCYQIVGDKILFFSAQDEPASVIDTTEMIQYEPNAADLCLILERELKQPYRQRSMRSLQGIDSVENDLFEVSYLDGKIYIKEKKTAHIVQEYNPTFPVNSIQLTEDNIVSLYGRSKEGARNGQCVSILSLNRSFEDARQLQEYYKQHPWRAFFVRKLLRR